MLRKKNFYLEPITLTASLRLKCFKNLETTCPFVAKYGKVVFEYAIEYKKMFTILHCKFESTPHIKSKTHT